jgi:thiol reductant ABC exporter, CydC subunit
MKVLPPPERKAIRRVFALLDVAKGPLTWSIATGVATIVCAVGLTAVSAWLIARASQMPLVASLALGATIVRAFGASRPVFRYLRQLTSHSVALYGMSHLRSAVYSKLADSRIDRVTQIRRGDLLARTGRDVDAVGDLVVRALLPLAVAVVASGASVALVAYFSPAVALSLACSLAAAGVLGSYAAMRGARRAELQQVSDRAELAALSLTMLESSDELLVSGRMGSLKSAIADIEQRIFANRDSAARPGALFTVIETLAMGCSVLAALVIGSGEVARAALTPVELAIVVLVPLAAFEAIDPLGEAGVHLVRSAAASRRILELLDGADATTTAGGTSSASADASAASSDTSSISASAGIATLADAPASGLVARDLVIGWPDGPALSGPIDLSVERGSSLALVGPSGIGKSTLLYTLAGMLEPKSGVVLLNGKPAHLIARPDVSTTLTLTSEDAHLFATSILENLRVARSDVSESEACSILEKVGLGPWLNELPDGVHTILGTDATNVSGGERRRLLLARALASPAQYLLLDEPAEHLDGETADALIRDLLATTETTVVLVSHRLTALEDVDRVVVLDNVDGQTRVRAQGTHEELAAMLPGYRWSLSREGGT